MINKNSANVSDIATKAEGPWKAPRLILQLRQHLQETIHHPWDPILLPVGILVPFETIRDDGVDAADQRVDAAVDAVANPMVIV
jgi:hypothetical protein